MLSANESVWFGVAAALAVKASLILVFACGAAFLLRKSSAAMRHLVWTAAAAALAVLPVLSLALPAVPVPAGRALLAELSVSVSSHRGADAQEQRAIPPALNRNSRQPAPLPWLPGWRLILISLWVAGTGVAFTQLLLARVSMKRMRHMATPWPDRIEAHTLAQQLQLTPEIDILETATGTMPMAFGILHPGVLMPRDARVWSVERRRVVLLHEFAHIRRGDLAAHLLARLAFILNWWNPLAWIAWREFLKDSERAADDLVLHAGEAAADYAGHLLAIARSMQAAPAPASAALAIARHSQLEGRIMSILDSRINRRAAGRVAVLAAALLAIALVSPLAALRGQETPSTQVPADVEATIRAAQTQKNYEMLDGPAAALITARQYELARKLLQSGAAIRQQVAGDNSVEYGIGVTKLADLQMKQNRFGDAESLYEKAVGAIGDRPEASRPLIMLGVIMLHEKNRGAAMDYFQRAQRVNPSGAGPAWTWMAVAGRDDPAQAEAGYNSALALEKADSEEAATTLELFADFLKAQGRPTEAQPLSDRAKAIRTALAPARKTTAGVYKMGGSVTPPKILSKMEPEYTEEARLAKYQGTAIVYVEIGLDGVPRNVQIARGLGMGLDDNAVAAISNWRFQPASKDGAPVPVMATIEVNFRLM